VSGLLRQAEEILGVAASGNSSSGDLVIVVDRQGGIRMLDAAGWSLAALQTHCGAASLFKVERRGETVRVEGWEPGERCLVERSGRKPRLSDLPGFAAAPRAVPPAPLLIAA
jgi:hypothetical protein